MSTFRLPDLGEGLHDAELVTWHVSTGDYVVADQPLVSVETAKAVVDIPSPRSGRISKLHGEPGDVIAVGAVMVEFDDDDKSESETVVGVLPHEGAAPRLSGASVQRTSAAAAVQAAPAVRGLARDLGINISSISGSGPGGAVTQADVRSAAAPQSTLEGAEPLRGPRRAMALAMTRAGAEVVPATVSDEALIDDWEPGTDIIVGLIKAIVAACRTEPALNAWFDSAAGQRKLNEKVDLGIAFDSSEGLFVPVVRDAGALNERELRRSLEQLKEAVHKRSLTPGDLTGQTITLSNFGSIGGLTASLVVTPPQVAILGAGRLVERVVNLRGNITTKRVLPLSLTFDHRVVTGGEAARFLRAAIKSLQSGDKELGS